MENCEIDIEKFWSRRIAGAHQDEVITVDVLLENQVLFPPAQVQAEDEISSAKSRPSSPLCPLRQQSDIKDEVCYCRCVDEFEADISADSPEGVEVFDGSSLKDIPCRYTVPKAESYEMTAVGVYIDPRIVPGFKYTIRPLNFDNKKNWLFNGVARELQSIGRGYSRRITLKPLPGHVNDNPDYFWTDSNDAGFAFSIQVLSPRDKFTLFNTELQAVAQLELTQLQGPQVEVSNVSGSRDDDENVPKDGGIEKTVKVTALCKVDWFDEQESLSGPIVQVSGLCVCVVKGGKFRVVCVKDVVLRAGKGGLEKENHCVREGYTLRAGVCSSLRSLRVSGTAISDVPTCYTIVGIEPYHFPVIGTYMDKRIVPGFHYRVQLGGCGNKLFGGKALRLESIGRGYAKRITFESTRPNRNDNHFWSDSHPEGFGFEVSAVRPGMEFDIMTRDDLSIVGHAYVFRDDCSPQVELNHSIVEEEDGSVCVEKRVQVVVKCEVRLDMSTQDDYSSHIIRVSGTAILYKRPHQKEAKVIRIIDVGLDSQLNMKFTNQLQELVLSPRLKP